MAGVVHVALNLDYFPMDLLQTEVPRERQRLEPTEAVRDKGEEDLEELLLLPTRVIDRMAASTELFNVLADEESVDEVLETNGPECQAVRQIIKCLTREQQDIVRRVVLEGRSIQGVARRYGMKIEEVSLSISCSLFHLEEWEAIPSIGRVVRLGRALGF